MLLSRYPNITATRRPRAARTRILRFFFRGCAVSRFRYTVKRRESGRCSFPLANRTAGEEAREIRGRSPRGARDRPHAPGPAPLTERRRPFRLGVPAVAPGGGGHGEG